MQRPDGLCSSDHRLATNIFFECFIVKTGYNAAFRSGLGFCVLGGEYTTTIELMRLTDLASIKGDSSNPACHFKANFLSQTLGGRCSLSGNFGARFVFPKAIKRSRQESAGRAGNAITGPTIESASSLLSR